MWYRSQEHQKTAAKFRPRSKGLDYEYDVGRRRLNNLNVVKELAGMDEDGGDAIYHDGVPIGWMKTDDSGTLEALELAPEYQRRGLGKKILRDHYGNESFYGFMPSEAAHALHQSYGTEEDLGDGIWRVTPHPLPPEQIAPAELQEIDTADDGTQEVNP